MGDDELLIRVKAAAVNPVDMLNLTGAVRLIRDDSMPLPPAMNAPVSWRKRADLSPDSGREIGSMPACRSSVSGKWPFPLQGVGSARHRLVADQRCLAIGGGRINGKVILRLQSFCRKCSGLRNQAAVFMSTLFIRSCMADIGIHCLQIVCRKLAAFPFSRLTNTPKGYIMQIPLGGIRERRMRYG